MKYLTKEHFIDILTRVSNIVFEGKGKERHGKDLEFEHQPWKFIADHIGSTFLDGQAVKKIIELKSMTTYAAYEREILGAISYLVMSLMYKEYISSNITQ